MEEKTKITIDEKEYFLEDMTETQRLLINHLTDINKKINSTQFQLDQLTVSKEAFFEKLKEELDK